MADRPVDPRLLADAARAMDKIGAAASAIVQSGQDASIRNVGFGFTDFARQLTAVQTVLKSTAPHFTQLMQSLQKTSTQIDKATFSLDKAHSRALDISRGPRDVGRQITERAREDRERARAVKQSLGYETNALMRTIGKKAYGVSDVPGADPGLIRHANVVGNTEMIASAAREKVQARMADRTRLLLEKTLEDTMGRKMLSDHTSGGARIWVENQFAQEMASEQDARRRLAESQARRRVGLGGAGAGPGFNLAGGEAISRLRENQEMAIDANLAAGYEEANEALQKNVEAEKRRLALLKSPEGKSALKEEARLKREQEKVTRQVAYQEEIARRGGFAGRLAVAGKRLDEMKESLRGMATLAQSAFAGIATAAVGLGSIADPFVAFPTFVESIKSLAIEVGSMFLPVLDGMSARVQGLAKWFGTLSNYTKTWAARIAVWVGAGTLFIATIYKAIAALSALKVAMATNPWTAGIVLATSLVAALGAEFLILGENASEAAKMVGKVGDLAGAIRGQPLNKYSVTPEEVERLKRSAPPAYAKLMEANQGSPKAMRMILSQLERVTSRDMDALKKANLANIRETPAEKKLRDIFSRFDADKEAYESAKLARARRLRVKPDSYGNQAEAALDTMGKSGYDGLVGAIKDAGLRWGKDIDMNMFTKLLVARFEGDSLRAGGFDRSKKASRELMMMENRLKLTRDMIDKAGLAEDIKRSYRFPVAPAIMDSTQYMERLTIAGLKGDDLGAKNLQRQLEEATKTAENTRGMVELQRELNRLLTEFELRPRNK